MTYLASRRSISSLACAAAIAAALSAPSVASANGRYPSAGQIAVHPSDPQKILVRATYGVLLTKDRGGRWGWVCEQAIGYSGNEDPMMAFTADGTILAAIFEGLSSSRDLGCDWTFAGGGLADKFVVDLSTERADPSKAVSMISNSSGPGTFLTQLWETSDDGKTWTQAGVDLPEEFLALTVDTAPSNRDRVYASGRYGAPDYPGTIERSDDRGMTWQKLPIPGADSTHLPYIAAIDPSDPDLVYVRLDGDPGDELIVSHDGGLNWTSVFQTAGNMLGFALSPDGATVAAGGDKDGLWTAPASTLAFTKVSNVGVRCLTWNAQGMYACADEFVDGFEAGLSTDQGLTFTPLMHLQTLCGPLQCDATTTTGSMCPDFWGTVQTTLQATCDDDAGPSTSSSSGSSGGTEVDGCSCGLPSSGASLAAPGIALLGAAALLARRRRRR